MFTSLGLRRISICAAAVDEASGDDIIFVSIVIVEKNGGVLMRISFLLRGLFREKREREREREREEHFFFHLFFWTAEKRAAAEIIFHSPYFLTHTQTQTWNALTS